MFTTEDRERLVMKHTRPHRVSLQRKRLRRQYREQSIAQRLLSYRRILSRKNVEPHRIEQLVHQLEMRLRSMVRRLI